MRVFPLRYNSSGSSFILVYLNSMPTTAYTVNNSYHSFANIDVLLFLLVKERGSRAHH